MPVVDSSPLLDAAIAYARRGWPVFPCNPKNKRPFLAKDKDADGKPIKGSGGVSKATTDEEQIRAWWRKWPRAMIGVSVGNLEDGASVQLMLPLDGDTGAELDVAVDVLRNRFGSGAVVRGSLLGKNQGVSVPLLPE